MYKYSDIPKMYGKLPCIKCVAYQEWELTNGTTKIFGDISENKCGFLNYAKSIGITCVKFSDLLKLLVCLNEINYI